MKRLLSVLLVLILCASICVGSLISADESGNEVSYYGRILGLGDSWLCGVGANPTVKVPVKAAETLGWEYGSLGGAAGGWYTSNVVNVIDSSKSNNVYDEMVDADVILIHVGTNDFCSTSYYTSSIKNGSKTYKQMYDSLETSYINKINGIISTIKTNNSDALVLLSTMWCSHTNGYTDRLAELENDSLTDAEIDAIYEETRNYYRVLAQKSANEKLAQIAQNNENVELFDVDTLMGYSEEKGNGTYVSSNRHPKASGYELMAEEVVKIIREFYGEESPTFAHTGTTTQGATTVTTTTTTSSTTTTKADDENDFYTIEDVSVGKNWQVGQYDMNNGSYNSSNTKRACLKKLVAVDPATTYVLNATNASGKQFVVREYNADKAFVKSYGTVILGGKYTPSSSAVAYVGITIYDGAPLADIQAGTIVPSMTVYGSAPSATTTTTTTQNQQQSSSSSNVQGVAMIVETGKGYTSFASAFTAAQSGQTVKLLESTSVPKMSEFQKSVTVDLNGNTISATENRLFVIKGTGNKLTIKNGNIVSGNVSYCSIILARAGNSFTVDGVNVTSTATKAGDANLDSMFNFMTSSSTERVRYEILNSNISHTGSGYILKYYISEADNTDIVISNSTIKSAKEPFIAKKGTLTILDSTIETTSERIGSASMFEHYLALQIPSGQWVKGYTNAGESKEFKTDEEIADFLQGINKKAASGGYSFFKIEFKKAQTDDQTTDIISTNESASIRLNEVNGMRFSATVNGDISNIDEMGIIIAPKDIIGEELTMDDKHVKVVYNHKNHDLWYGGKIVGSIVAIKDENLTRDFVARAYVVIGGVTYYAKDSTARNVSSLADSYIADTDSDYSILAADKKELVDRWAKAND